MEQFDARSSEDSSPQEFKKAPHDWYEDMLMMYNSVAHGKCSTGGCNKRSKYYSDSGNRFVWSTWVKVVDADGYKYPPFDLQKLVDIFKFWDVLRHHLSINEKSISYDHIGESDFFNIINHLTVLRICKDKLWHSLV